MKVSDLTGSGFMFVLWQKLSQVTSTCRLWTLPIKLFSLNIRSWIIFHLLKCSDLPSQTSSRISLNLMAINMDQTQTLNLQARDYNLYHTVWVKLLIQPVWDVVCCDGGQTHDWSPVKFWSQVEPVFSSGSSAADIIHSLNIFMKYCLIRVNSLWTEVWTQTIKQFSITRAREQNWTWNSLKIQPKILFRFND